MSLRENNDYSASNEKIIQLGELGKNAEKKIVVHFMPLFWHSLQGQKITTRSSG
jgi:hypothetical protein